MEGSLTRDAPSLSQIVLLFSISLGHPEDVAGLFFCVLLPFPSLKSFQINPPSTRA